MILSKETFLKLVFTVWLVLWLFFLFREDKEGQYRSLEYLYTHSHNERVRYLMGNELYDFLNFCKKNMPEASSYELAGIENLSIDRVRARYFLWPLKNVAENADFKIVYGKDEAIDDRYEEYKKYKEIGTLLIKKDKGKN